MVRRIRERMTGGSDCHGGDDGMRCAVQGLPAQENRERLGEVEGETHPIGTRGLTWENARQIEEGETRSRSVPDRAMGHDPEHRSPRPRSDQVSREFRQVIAP